MSADDQKVIFSMVRVSKTHGKKTVLRDISLGFFYGEKIGVLGLNGSGKSTLLKIMADAEEPSDGQVVRSPGYSVGMLEQEPTMTAGKTVLEVVEEGAADSKALLDEFVGQRRDNCSQYRKVQSRFGHSKPTRDRNENIVGRHRVITSFLQDGKQQGQLPAVNTAGNTLWRTVVCRCH